MVKTNDLPKGTRVLLDCGWYATLEDNKKGNTRIADVEGYFRESGSIYSHDIVRALVDGKWVPVEHTPEQLNLRKMVASM